MPARVDWEGFSRDHSKVRDAISAVIPGFDDFNERIETPGGFVLPHGPRDERRFDTPDGRAHFTVNELTYATAPPGTLLLQTLRSHDQYNTTIYGLDDRYRGIIGGRRVVFVSPDDLRSLGRRDGDMVDLRSTDDAGRPACRGRLPDRGVPDTQRLVRRVLPRDERARAAPQRRRGGNPDVQVDPCRAGPDEQPVRGV